MPENINGVDPLRKLEEGTALQAAGEKLAGSDASQDIRDAALIQTLKNGDSSETFKEGSSRETPTNRDKLTPMVLISVLTVALFGSLGASTGKSKYSAHSDGFTKFREGLRLPSSSESVVLQFAFPSDR